MRDWVTNLSTTHYLVGSAIGPAPFPTIVRDFQSVIGQEIKEQMIAATGKLPDAVVACVGGGSNAIGCVRQCERGEHECMTDDHVSFTSEPSTPSSRRRTSGSSESRRPARVSPRLAGSAADLYS